MTATTMNREKIEELKKAAQPLMDWLEANAHPHCTVIVDAQRAELLEGVTQVVNIH